MIVIITLSYRYCNSKVSFSITYEGGHPNRNSNGYYEDKYIYDDHQYMCDDGYQSSFNKKEN